MNYLTQEYRVTNPPQLGDINLARSVMTSMQGKYDANSAMISQTLALYNQNLKGLRESDNSYIADKLKRVKTEIDNYSKKNSNLAYGYNKDSIISAITSTLEDPIVMDAITSRQNYMSYNAQVEKLKEKDSGKYVNDDNFKYGLHEGGYSDYISGKTNKLGAMTYTPYIDLREKHLKDLKTIKDIKGKKTIETLDGQGNKITKSIDGMTDEQIKDYFDSNLSGQERKQMLINGWGKYGNSDKEARDVYAKYTNQKIKNYETNLLTLETQSKNPNIGVSTKEEKIRERDNVKNKLSELKNTDISKISLEDLSYNLEKAGYVDSISQVAGAEWSVSYGKDDVYFANKQLDIDYQELALKQAKEQRETLEFKAKMAKDYNQDTEGNPLVDNNLAKSTRETALVDQDEAKGAKSLKTTHDKAYQEMQKTASDFLNTASTEDKQIYLNLLKTKGINSNLQFEEGKGTNNSLVNTLYTTFKEGGFGNKYANTAKNFATQQAIKSTTSVNILNTQKEGLNEVYNKNPDKYVNDFIDIIEERNDNIDIKSAFTAAPFLQNAFTNSISKDYELKIKAENFIREAGGKDNIKSYLQKNPEKIITFSNILNDGSQKLNFSLDTNLSRSNLTKDSKKQIEQSIQRKTEQGIMTSLYNDFNFTNQDVKTKVLSMIPNERTFIRGQEFTDGEGNVRKGTAVLDRSKDANTSFYQNGENIIMVQQSKEAGAKALTTETVLMPGDAAYSQIKQYVDLSAESTKDITVTRDFKLPTIKVNALNNNGNIHTESTENVKGSINEIMINNPQIARVFKVPAIALSTMDITLNTLDVLYKNKIPDVKRQELKTAIKNNLNNLSVQPKSVKSLNNYNLNLTYKTSNDKEVRTINLGTNKIDEDLNYLINYHPHLFIMNQFINELNNDPSQVDNIISQIK